MRDFKKQKVWQQSHQLGLEFYKVFPDEILITSFIKKLKADR